MADSSDVENALVALLAQTLYPNGTSKASVAGTPVRLPYRGWPVPDDLDADLKNGMVNVTVFPQAVETNVTRYKPKWFDLLVVAPQLVATVDGDTITISGVPSSALNFAVVVNGLGFVYPVQASDTLTSIATGLAAIINASIPATSEGAVVTLSDAVAPTPSMSLSETRALKSRFGGAILASLAGFWPTNALHVAVTGMFGKRFGGAILASLGSYWHTPDVGITARVVGVGPVIREIRRQKRSYQITFWCPLPLIRDAVAAPCDAALAGTDYLQLSDGTLARLRYERTLVSDKGENNNLYRRDLIYSVEYGTTQTMNVPKVSAQQFVLQRGLEHNSPQVKRFFN